MIFNMTGPGISGGKLTVTTPGAGITVAAARDGKTKTRVSGADGTAVFKGLEGGDWVLTITDGSQTSVPVPITIKTDYAAALTFFAATIHVTYPAGSVCTATDGAITLTAPDTGGTWDCTVPNAGTWTVTATDGSDTDAADVTITEDGQAESANLAFWHGELYTRGNTWDDVTGGWSALLDRSTVSFNSDSIQFHSGCVHATVYTNRPIDLTNFSKLTADCAITATDYKFELGVKLEKPTNAQQSGGYVAVTATGVTAGKTLTVDVSDLSGSYYILLYSMTSVGYVTNVKLS